VHVHCVCAMYSFVHQPVVVLRSLRVLLGSTSSTKTLIREVSKSQRLGCQAVQDASQGFVHCSTVCCAGCVLQVCTCWLSLLDCFPATVLLLLQMMYGEHGALTMLCMLGSHPVTCRA
jgi:hypothetical protein